MTKLKIIMIKTLVKLEDVCEILDNKRIPITQQFRKKGIYPYYGANGIQDYVDDYIFDDELVLLAEDGGHFGSKDKPIAYRVSGKCWVNNHAHVLKPLDNINVDYLCYSLMFYDVSNIVNGSTRKKLNQADMRKILIPFISLDQQQKIVSILDQVNHIISLRTQQLEQLDLLIKSRFVEMFGDPVEERFIVKSLPEVTIDDKNSIKRGPFGGSLKKDDFVDCGYLVYEQRHAIHNDFNYEKYYISEEKYKEMEMFKVVPGDLIISCSGVTLGRIAEIPLGAKKGIINQALLKLTLNKEVMLNSFFMTLFKSEYIQRILFGFSRGSGIPNFPSMSEVKAIKFLCPPIELQKQYENFLNQVDKAKASIKKSLEQLEILKKKLMQDYFG